MQEGHLLDIKHDFLVLVDDKYRKGQSEHGGNLFDLSPLQLIDSAIEEAIDQFVYLVTLKEKIRPKYESTTSKEESEVRDKSQLEQQKPK